jgi:hypothetical protein
MSLTTKTTKGPRKGCGIKMASRTACRMVERQDDCDGKDREILSDSEICSMRADVHFELLLTPKDLSALSILPNLIALH